MNKKCIFFIRPQYSNVFAKTGPVVTEPLELEYLVAIATRMGFTCHIHDPFVDKRPLQPKIQQHNPGIVAITGYYPARKEVFRIIKTVKTNFPEVVILAGGADIEVCYADYFKSHADILIYSSGFETFRKILENLWQGNLKQLDGICYRNKDGGFVQNRRAAMASADIPTPDRAHFYRYRSSYYYIGYGETALVKGSFSCPYSCSFCYARLLNGGAYLAREIDDLLDEIEGIDAKTIWLVDDVFLPDEKRAFEFIDQVEKRGLKKEFIIYSRADFICEHEHLIPKLKNAGVVNVITGLEAVNNRELNAYHKGYTADINERCARILAQNGITLTALFIAGLDADFRYFFNLFTWILRNRVKMFTVSVYTPLPGTRDFEIYQSRLITRDPSKWDFMHLVVKPQKTGFLRFYACLWGLYFFQALMNPAQMKSYVCRCIKGKAKQLRGQYAAL